VPSQALATFVWDISSENYKRIAKCMLTVIFCLPSLLQTFSIILQRHNYILLAIIRFC
jgi:hypothetical protein